MKQLKMTELKTIWEQNSARNLILDVRTPEEFRESRVPGVKHIPIDELSQRAAELDLSKELFIYCRSGGRAGMAAMELMNKGAKHVSVITQSGMPDWERAGFPVERG